MYSDILPNTQLSFNVFVDPLGISMSVIVLSEVLPSPSSSPNLMPHFSPLPFCPAATIVPWGVHMVRADILVMVLAQPNGSLSQAHTGMSVGLQTTDNDCAETLSSTHCSREA